MRKDRRQVAYLGAIFALAWLFVLSKFLRSELPSARRSAQESFVLGSSRGGQLAGDDVAGGAGWPRGDSGESYAFDEEDGEEGEDGGLVSVNVLRTAGKSQEELDEDAVPETTARGHHHRAKDKGGRDSRHSPDDLPERSHTGEEARYLSKKLLNNVRFVDATTRLITHRRQFVIWNATLGSVVHRNYLEYFDWDTNTTIPYKFPPELFRLLPLNEPHYDYGRCAVVGNSGVSLVHLMGPEIDAHDAVFRMNLAPVRGFEQHVGSRTTFQIVNSPNIREMLTGSLRWRTNDNTTKLVMFETGTQFARYHLAPSLLEEHGDRALLLNPNFANHCLKLWLTLKESLELDWNLQFHRKPMSGFYATLMALQMCDHVDLYGFDAYTSSKTRNLYHYFDHVQGFTDVHSFDLAMHIFRQLERRGVLTVKS